MFEQPDQPNLFTYDEASALLPFLRDTLSEIQDQKQHLDKLRQKLRSLRPAMRSNGHAEYAADLDEQIRRDIISLRGKVQSITDRGVLLKDIDAGLMDFPTLRNGRIVYLCWMVNEPSIEYWHEVDAGFTGRKPIDD